MQNPINQNTSIVETSKKIASLAFPMAINQFINTASGFLCMAMLAHLGHQVLAASALIFPTQLPIMALGFSFLFSIGILVGRAYGANDYFTIGNIVQQGWTLGLILSLPIILTFLHMKAILIFLGQEKEIAGILQNYFNAYVWCVVPMLLSVTNMQFGYGIHKKLLVVSASIFSVLILLGTSYILIFGKLGFPKLGVAGLGYGIACQNIFFFLFTSSFYYFNQSFKKFDLFNYRVHKHLGHFAEMFKLSWPISLQMGGEMFSLLASGAMVGWLGIVSLAAYQVVNQYAFLVIVPMFALSQASGILVGQACGAKKFNEVKQLGYTSLLVVLSITSLFAALFILFPKLLASFYLDINNPANAATVHLIVPLFCIIAFSQIFDGLRNVLIGTLRGLLDSRFPMYIGLSVIWLVGIPLSYLLAFTFHFGVMGIAFGGLIGMLIGATILFFRWRKLSQGYRIP